MSQKLPKMETLTIEFKSDRAKLPDAEIFEAVIAFANTEGGDLYLGIEDDGTVTGIHKSHSNPITLSAYIANNTIPPVSVRCEMIEDVLPVLKISVPKSQTGVVATVSGKILRRRMKHDNTPANVPMYPAEISTRLSDLRLVDYSSMAVMEASLTDIDSLEIERLRRIILAYDGDRSLLELDNDELLKALGFARAQNGTLYPTITGILMVGKTESIKRFVPTAIASFQVLEGTQVRVNEDFVLPVLASVEKLIEYLNVWNPERELEVGLFRMPAPDFNRRAIREAIVNAFSHRDYSKMGRIRVAIADEGLTISNPGGFIEGVTVNNLLAAEPHGRNPLLADALKRVGLAEKTGRGIDRIFEGSLIYGRALPDYTASTTSIVSLFIPRCKPDIQLTKLISDEQSRLGRPLPLNTLRVLNQLKQKPRSNRRQLAEALHLSEVLISTVLDTSIEHGLIEAQGIEREQRFTLSRRLYSDKSAASDHRKREELDVHQCYELILGLARKNTFISRADVIELLQVTDSKAYSLLKKLVDQGRLQPVNKGRYARYKI